MLKSSVDLCDALFKQDYLPFVHETITYNIKTSIRLHVFAAVSGLVTQKSNILHITLKNSNALHYLITPWRK